MTEGQGQQVLCCCEACKKGFAECVCPLAWADDESRARRASEIRTIRGAVLRHIELAEARRPDLMRVDLRLPSSLVLRCRQTAASDGVSLSRYLRRTLHTFSGHRNRILFSGSTKRITARLDAPLVARLRLRAETERESLSEAVIAHLEREVGYEPDEV